MRWRRTRRGWYTTPRSFASRLTDSVYAMPEPGTLRDAWARCEQGRRMRVVIVGAGAVGSYLAERLSLEGQDVVVIEADPARAAEVQEQIDCLVIHGNGASLESLDAAGVEKADLFIAVSSSDAVNVLAAHAATRLGSPRRIARVEDPQLRDEAENLGVDLLIDPGEATARELLLLVQQRGVSELIEFADGHLDLIGGYIAPDAPVAGLTLAQLREQVTSWSWLVVAVIRDGETVIARGSTQVLPGDHVLFMTETDKTDEPFRLLGISEVPCGEGGDPRRDSARRAHRADPLCAAGYPDDPRRLRIPNGCGRSPPHNPKVTGICGDPTSPRLLEAEGVDSADVVLALTGWDEVNILGCLVAKAIGVPTVVARFHRMDLVRLLAGVGIDAGVSSRLSAASQILRFVRRGRIHTVVTFQDSDAEALEIEVGLSSPAAGKTLRDAPPPARDDRRRADPRRRGLRAARGHRDRGRRPSDRDRPSRRPSPRSSSSPADGDHAASPHHRCGGRRRRAWRCWHPSSSRSSIRSGVTAGELAWRRPSRRQSASWCAGCFEAPKVTVGTRRVLRSSGSRGLRSPLFGTLPYLFTGEIASHHRRRLRDVCRLHHDRRVDRPRPGRRSAAASCSGDP